MRDNCSPERPNAVERDAQSGYSERDRDDEDEAQERGERVADEQPEAGEHEPDDAAGKTQEHEPSRARRSTAASRPKPLSRPKVPSEPRTPGRWKTSPVRVGDYEQGLTVAHRDSCDAGTNNCEVVPPSTATAERRHLQVYLLGMALRRMEHVGVVVNDLAAATAFFVELGFELQHEGEASGEWVDRIVGLTGVRQEIAMLETPDGAARLELQRYGTPDNERGSTMTAANVPGLRHVAFSVDDLNETVERLTKHGASLVGEAATYEDTYRLCYLYGPDGIIVELAEQVN